MAASTNKNMIGTYTIEVKRLTAVLKPIRHFGAARWPLAAGDSIKGVV